ncbi:MAG: hypothetical protein AAGK32_02135 [Actinomycetota bacterium]
MSLLRLRSQQRVADALSYVQGRPDEVFLPRLVRSPQGTFSLYQADPAYDSQDLDAPGPRHRMQMLDKGYRYYNEIDPPPG